MKKRRIAFVFILSLALGACSKNPSGPVGLEDRINNLLAKMSLEEKIAQMHGLQFLPVDGLWHTPENSRLGIVGFKMVDGPRGVQAGESTAFPVGMARGATWDPALEERVGEAIGKEVRAYGGNVLLAPTINIVRHPGWGRAQETYGEDIWHVGEMGLGFIRGAQKQVVASVKHYALNSIENTRFTVNVSVDERTLREIYLPHFKKAVQEGSVGSVMSAYNKVNGAYCAENAYLLRDILKEEWGFDGFVESDWLLGTRSTVSSALAGLDIEMPAANYYGNPLKEAVDSGNVPLSVIDDAVRRILRIKLRFKLDQLPVVSPTVIESSEHTALAKEVARKSIVLLKNKNGALPLDASSLQSLVVVGALADLANMGDKGSSVVHPSYAVTPLAGIQSQAGTLPVTYIAGPSMTSLDESTIASADAAIVIAGLTWKEEGEAIPGGLGGDRLSLDLPQAQEELIKAVAEKNARTIVVLEGGAAITMGAWIEVVAAVMMAWYPGMEGGHAIAEILFGEVNPSGKLPITFAATMQQLPDFIADQEQVRYDFFHGYRLTDQQGYSPQFPFGFGLSYTSYGYGNLSLSEAVIRPSNSITIEAEITNTGAKAGEEIAQLYIGATGSRVARPLRELKGFRRLALAPGEKKTVSFTIKAKDLAYYDVAARAWKVEELTYTVHIGPSSAELPLTGSFKVSTLP